MPRKQKKYHYLYKTTNLINGKFYVGMHSTDNLNDGYLGSGKRLRYSISKYGKDNFKIEHLEFFEDRKTLAEKEKNLVNEELIKDIMCMNLHIGGEGGFSKEHALKGRITLIKRLESDENLKMHLLKNLNGLSWKDTFSWKGKKHSSKTINKLINHNRQTGEKNSQFGTCWINNGIINKKIKKEELQKYKDWVKGRLTK